MLAGALHYTDPVSVDDPQGLALAYLRAFERLGGKFVQGNAASLEAERRRLARAHRAGPAVGRRRGDRARAVGRRADARARLRPAARGEARLSHALPRRGRGAAEPPDARHRARLLPRADAARHPAHHRRGVRAARRDQDAGAARPRRADRARPVPARRAARHRAVDGRAALHARHAADHRPRAAPRQPVVRFRPRAPRPHARRGDRQAGRGDDDAARRRSSTRRRIRPSASADGDLRHRRRPGLLR